MRALESAGSLVAEPLDWVASGLNPPVGRLFRFDDAKAALTFALEGSGLGKTVLRIPEADHL
jgi:hypothetical protein